MFIQNRNNRELPLLGKDNHKKKEPEKSYTKKKSQNLLTIIYIILLLNRSGRTKTVIDYWLFLYKKRMGKSL